MDLAVYQALYAYNPSDEEIQDGHISLEVADLVEVRDPKSTPDFTGTVEQPAGWLRGVHQKTKQSGYFPGTGLEPVVTQYQFVQNSRRRTYLPCTEVRK